MSIHPCPEGTLLLANVAEALRRQCELPALTNSPKEIALEMDTAEALQSANRHAADHLCHCATCRANQARRYPASRQLSQSSHVSLSH